MKIMILILINFGLSSILYASAYVTDDEDLISTDSNYSEDSEASGRDIFFYRSNSFKNLDILIKNGGIDASRRIRFKEELESFYTKVCSFLIVDLSTDTFKSILASKKTLKNSLFSSGEGFFCGSTDLVTHRDSIVQDLETISKMISKLLPDVQDQILSRY